MDCNEAQFKKRGYWMWVKVTGLKCTRVCTLGHFIQLYVLTKNLDIILTPLGVLRLF